MLCTIIDIRGDYAMVKYADTGVISEVAIALLPFYIYYLPPEKGCCHNKTHDIVPPHHYRCAISA